MKQQYRHTKAPEPTHDRPLKKRGGKDKPFRIIAPLKDWVRRLYPNWPDHTLGKYETRARAEQALPKFAREWPGCTIVES